MSDETERTHFEPEVVLPAQLPWGARGDGETSGARALMIAILEDAMRCIRLGRRRRHRQNRQLTEAEAWVRCDSREWLFSFGSICDVLGIEADALRVRLLTSVALPARQCLPRAVPSRAWNRTADADQPCNRPGRTGQNRKTKRRFV